MVRSEDEVAWRLADGTTVGCEEKRKVLNENLAEIRQICQDALEDALLMGCDDDQMRDAIATVVKNLRNPLKARQRP